MTCREHSLAVSNAFCGSARHRKGHRKEHRGGRRCRGRALSWLLALFLLAATIAASEGEANGNSSGSGSGSGWETLILHTHQGISHRLQVLIAATPAEQRRGLMFRTTLPAKHGMLFLHDPPQRVVMWMKNTYLPLDMIFLDREGKVVQIVERTTPLSLARIRSTQPVSGVLELAAGSVRSLSLAKGDRAEHRFFRR